MDVVVDGSPLIVFATFTTIADGKNYALEVGDSIDVTLRDRTEPLLHSVTTIDERSDAYFLIREDESLQAGDVVTVTLHRGSDDLVSTAMWPVPVVLDPLPLFVSRAAPLTFTWAAAGAPDGVDYSVSGCTSAVNEHIPDSGMFTIPANALTLMPDSPPTCSVGLNLERRVTAAVDPGFGAGAMTLTTTALDSFASTP